MPSSEVEGSSPVPLDQCTALYVPASPKTNNFLDKYFVSVYYAHMCIIGVYYEAKENKMDKM